MKIKKEQKEPNTPHIEKKSLIENLSVKGPSDVEDKINEIINYLNSNGK